MLAFTDYPIKELGDKEYSIAPMREVEVISYDGSKYCQIAVEGVKRNINKKYLYAEERGFKNLIGMPLETIKH